MKKLIFTTTMLSFILLTGSTAFCQPTTVELNTTIPAPFGSFYELRLTPHTPTTLPQCDGSTAGMFYVEATDDIYFCRDDQWRIIGVWSQVGDDIYITDRTNPGNKRLVIGGTVPEFRLTLDSEGGIIARGTFGPTNETLPNLTTTGAGARMIWYPKKGAFRAGEVDGTQWNDPSIGWHSAAFGEDNTAAGNLATISGGYNNTIPSLATSATISGGQNNTASGSFDTVGGGAGNAVDGSLLGGASTIGGGNENKILAGISNWSTIAGGNQNEITGASSSIGGGSVNKITGTGFATISGGSGNAISGGALNATIGGGASNKILINSVAATVAGGSGNQANSPGGTVGGGRGNIVDLIGPDGVVSGGSGNTAWGVTSTIGGGVSNEAIGASSTVGGGNDNTATGDHSTISGGKLNSTAEDFATIAGGESNKALQLHATVGGGISNEAQMMNSTVSGGSNNKALSWGSTVGGGFTNVAGFNHPLILYSTVSGGANNTASGEGATVGGGVVNTASGRRSTVAGGGWKNQATAEFAVVTGGSENQATSWSSTVGGGFQNVASQPAATIAGGQENQAAGAASTVSGGKLNFATGSFAMIPGGLENVADGDYSLAAGRNMILDPAADRTFIWGYDPNPITPVTTADVFIVYSGRVGVGTTAPTHKLHVNGDARNLTGVWATSSDGRLKKNIKPLEGSLNRLVKLRGVIFDWKNPEAYGNRNESQIGFVAQDVEQAFPEWVRTDEDGYKLLEMTGSTALIVEAIKELNEKIIALEKENAELKKTVDRLRNN